MLDKILHLSAFMNASGSEHQIIDEICRILPDAKRLPDGSAYLLLNLQNKQTETIMISTPVDVIGFLALCKDNEIVTLQPTSKIDPKKYASVELIGEDGITHKSTLDKNKNLSISGNDIRIGDIFRLKAEYRVDSAQLTGPDSSVYSLLLILLQLAHCSFNKNVILHFAVQGKTTARSELCTAHRFNPDLCILLGSKEGEKNAILVKDGKHVISRNKLESLGVKANDDTYFAVSDDRITKASDLTSYGFHSVSIALAVKNAEKNEEAIALPQIHSLYHFICDLINRCHCS